MLSKGGRIHERGYNDYTPVISATSEGHLSIVDLLLSKGANMRDMGRNERSWIEMALIGKNCHRIELLLRSDAESNFEIYTNILV